ncbi:portal protein [Bacillus sp. Y1]|nr:phage portal protein [Bacillus sp. Y1]AYA77345.1 portal protein [Bacillus sp. Y1]
MAWYNRKDIEKHEENTVTYQFNAFQPGEEFPPPADRERISKYKRLKKTFKGRQYEVYERASALLKDSPHAPQLAKLYIAVNLADILVTKPADLLVGEPPSFESGKPDNSDEQKAVNRYVEENDLVKLIHESAIGNGYRGDAWIKTRFGYRQDFSEVVARGGSIPENVVMEPIIEHINAEFVFPETSRGNIKSFKAVNIATVEYVVTKKEEVPFLNVERHIPGYIIYERYRLHEFEGGVDNTYGYPLQVYKIGDKVATGREGDIVETGVPHLLVHHIPYKSVDDDWEGIGGLEKIESLLAAVNDRITQIDYILWKHSDPNSYGPDLEGVGDAGNALRMGGVYIPVTNEDVTPGYMTWDGQLTAAFKELEVLLALIFQNSETPQWLFGSVLGENTGGTGTSHTDSAAIKARFMPILSKVKRIRAHYDKAIRDALWTCQLLDIEHGDYDFEDVYPTINWRDGIPKNEKEEAEIMQIRTGNKPTLDVQSAIKRQDEVDDEKAAEIVARIDSDTQRTEGFVNPSIFNEDNGGE